MLWFATWTGFVVGVAGLVLVAKPIPRLGVTNRADASVVMALGVLLSVTALTWPAREQRGDTDDALQRFMPRYQFNEHHSASIAATPDVVMGAVRNVTANDIRLFRTLTWIRRGGRKLPESILNAGTAAPILDVATRSGFVWLHQAQDEIVVGTIIARPRGSSDTLSPELFTRALPPGWTLATMNFYVVSLGPGRSYVTTETRVYANSDRRRRQFAAYWRVIYPGSALIRRGWLRAIERRAANA
jgi:hypothetical protein